MERATRIVLLSAGLICLLTGYSNTHAEEPIGYTARACGFDMDRDGVVGEANDAFVGDGVTTDPDYDGTDEDILYVDANTGSDTTGDGTAGNPYKTVQKALNVADGPYDGAEDIICISGVFREAVTISDSGIPGYYIRDDFQFPNNPLMLIGWDKDGDGEYPPFDTDDTAVLDGNVGGNNLDIGIRTSSKRSCIEIAHLTVQNYGSDSYVTSGAMQLFHWGTGLQSHIYVHDVEMNRINYCAQDASARIVMNFWGGPMTDVAIINNYINEYSSYFCRGAPPSGAGRFRFQNLTLKMFSLPDVEHFVTGWKLWGLHNGCEILDNIINANAHAWNPTAYVSGIGVCQGAQDWTIRGNLIIDLTITLQPFAQGYYQGRRLDNIHIDRNIFLRTYSGWDTDPSAISITGHTDANVEESVEDVWITNNFLTADTTQLGYHTGIRCSGGNRSAPQPGTIRIAGNTIYGPFEYMTIWGLHLGGGIGIVPNTALPYKHNSYVIKNNIIANAGAGKNIEVNFAPTDLVANGNVYDPVARFRWDETRHWVTISFAEWQTATGQDANSKLDTPTFLDAPNDLHLDPNDTAAIGFGVDITGITTWDFDGDLRDPNNPCAGADVTIGAPPDTDPPTILSWCSAVTHGRSVGQALLEITDDGNFSEPRSDGIGKLIVEFSEALDPNSFTTGSVQIAGLDSNSLPVDLGSTSIGISLSGGDTIGEITFTPALPDYSKYLVRISGVEDVASNPLGGDDDRIITALVGDASSDLRVNAIDFSRIRAARTKLIDPGNVNEVRADVSTDGRVNASDLSRVRARRPNDARTIPDPVLGP